MCLLLMCLTFFDVSVSISISARFTSRSASFFDVYLFSFEPVLSYVSSSLCLRLRLSFCLHLDTCVRSPPPVCMFTSTPTFTSSPVDVHICSRVSANSHLYLHHASASTAKRSQTPTQTQTHTQTVDVDVDMGTGMDMDIVIQSKRTETDAHTCT